MSSTGCSDLDVVRSARARRVSLRFDPSSGRARLILPPDVKGGAGLARALAWAKGKAGWLDAQRAALPEARPFAPGAVLPVADRAVTIVREEGRRRTLVRDGDRLLAAGPEETIARRVGTWLRRESLALLTAETAAFAGKAGVTVTHVAVGDARGRWGSCSGSGAIRYNWRLLLAPGFVRRATVAHEVAHRVHMNHGPRFHALVAELFEEDPAPARAWLRAHGAGLHWYGRSS